MWFLFSFKRFTGFYAWIWIWMMYVDGEKKSDQLKGNIILIYTGIIVTMKPAVNIYDPCDDIVHRNSEESMLEFQIKPCLVFCLLWRSALPSPRTLRNGHILAAGGFTFYGLSASLRKKNALYLRREWERDIFGCFSWTNLHGWEIDVGLMWERSSWFVSVSGSSVVDPYLMFSLSVVSAFPPPRRTNAYASFCSFGHSVAWSTLLVSTPIGINRHDALKTTFFWEINFQQQLAKYFHCFLVNKYHEERRGSRVLMFVERKSS